VWTPFSLLLLPEHLLHVLTTPRLYTDLPSPRNMTWKCWQQLEVHPFGNPSSSRHPDMCVKPVSAHQITPLNHKSYAPTDRRTIPFENKCEEWKNWSLESCLIGSINPFLTNFLYSSLHTSNERVIIPVINVHFVFCVFRSWSIRKQ